MELKNLRFEKLKEQEPVDPSKAQFQSNVEFAFVVWWTIVQHYLLVIEIVFIADLADGVFQQRTRVAFSFFQAPDDAFWPILALFKAD